MRTLNERTWPLFIDALSEIAAEGPVPQEVVHAPGTTWGLVEDNGLDV